MERKVVVYAKCDKLLTNFLIAELDIAILRLSEDAPIGKEVYPAHLHRNIQDQLVGKKVQVGSWGNLDVTMKHNQKITIFETTVVDSAECNLMWSGEISQSVLCTQVENQTGLVNGDSGGTST